MPKTVVPKLGLESYSCPHCGALAHQDWFDCYDIERETPPVLLDEEMAGSIVAGAEPNMRETLRKYADRRLSREIHFDDTYRELYRANDIINLYIARCFSCKRLTLWLYDKILWPETVSDILPSADMPETIAADFKEAAAIVDKSPRGAAALLRLCLQKLCAHLSEKGKNIDEDIASMVRKGLDVRIQRALDVIRVIGNEAVHPGILDLRDDRATAMELFGLINLIVDTKITQPKRIDELYSQLPVEKLKAIERRDARPKNERDEGED